MSENMKILIAYDGSVCADNSIKDLPRAGLPREADALLVSVKERWLSPPSGSEVIAERVGSSGATAARTARDKAEPEILEIGEESPLLSNAYKELKANFPDWKISHVMLHGSPSSQIAKQAKDWNADLVVVGSQGHTGGKVFSLGSVSMKIANEAPCSVRVVRGYSWKKGSPSRILIGLDGTHYSHAAVEEVARRMWMMGSEVRLVTAKNPEVEKDNPSEETKRQNDWINSFVTKAEVTLENTFLGLSRVVEEGDPKQIIIRAADEWGADCIFIGSNDKGGFSKNLLLGSVATAIVARAHCTVEVVRHHRQPKGNNA